MKGILSSIAILAAFGAIIAAQAPSPSAAPAVEVRSLTWLQGEWVCEQFGGTYEERWTDPEGGLLQGMSKLIRNGSAAGMEFMTIEQTGESVTLFVALGALSKGDKKPTAFRLVEAGDKSLVFENLENEYPTRVAYSLRTGGNLFARISGNSQGKDTAFDFEFKPLK